MIYSYRCIDIVYIAILLEIYVLVCKKISIHTIRHIPFDCRSKTYSAYPFSMYDMFVDGICSS